MSSRHTTLCIVNTTGMDITQIDISEIDNNDWHGDSRPDHNFQGVSIKNNDSRCESEEINDYASYCPYRITLKFSNGTDLSFRNDQKDARTKINRSIYPDRRTAKYNLVAYQTSGGNTNAIYIRQKQEPDNSGWMGKLLEKKPDVRLNAITLPGSHDAGMYSTSNCTIGIEPAWTITQSCSIGDQLKIGSRYLDLRVYFDGFKNRYTGEHLSERIDYAEESSLKSLEKADQDFLKEEKVKERLTEFLQNK